MFLSLTKTEADRLRYEVISQNARLKLTRLVKMICKSESALVEIIKLNRFINISRNVLGKPLYILECDDMGEYQPFEQAWHFGEIEIIFRRPDTRQLVEILADMLQGDLVDVGSINSILAADGTSVYFEIDRNDEIIVKVLSIEEIDDIKDIEEHPNIRKLVKRLDNSLEEKDYSAVLHTSATIFETLAKDVIGTDSIENKSLGSFFDRYRNDSALPIPILDYILSIYNKRNTEPLAGHGSTLPSTIQESEAILIVELTKTFVRLERKLSVSEINIE